MKTITIEVKDDYTENVVNILNNLKEHMVNKITINSDINTKYCQKITVKIQKNDLSDFEKTTSKELFSDLGI